MGYALAADAVFVVHGLFILFVAFGGLLVAWRRGMAAIHLPAVLWGAGIEFIGGVCPLTPLENRLRALAGEDAHAGGYVAHYLLPLLYPDGLTRGAQLALGTGVIVLNVAVYAWALRAR